MLSSLNNALCGLNSLPVPPAFRCVYQWIRKPLEYSESDECNLSYRQPCRTRLSGSRTSNTSAKVDPQDKRWSGGAKKKNWKLIVATPPFATLPKIAPMPNTRPYSLRNLRNYLRITRSELHVKRICLPSIIANVANNELWKLVS